jgi:geranylgeranyl diphosphate synthase, type III
MAASSSSQPHEVDEKILEPFRYLLQNPGKDVRGALIDCFQEWLGVPEEALATIKDIIATLHNASLLVDDIEDNSKIRRGVPVAHAIYGIANTINCANYVYFLALEKCQSLRSDKAMSVFVAELLNLHRGQGRDILWREQCACPTEEEYRLMVSDKTGGLFRLAVGLMQAFSSPTNPHSKTDFDSLLYLFGLYFQIRDDYVNIASMDYQKSKSFCEDLSEGKFSFPLIHAIKSNPTDHRLVNILRQRTDDIDVKRHAVEYIGQCGSLEYTKSQLHSLKADIETELAKLGGHEKLSILIQRLHAKLFDKSDDLISAVGAGNGL